ncbi:hypothetical protein [Campylobacter ureolyticus]|uniref:hypothetical protein n=1 Tax=Campylobacter ureolyticus TaxID=827 RepID=UPI001FC8239C|nr:hypothetical protein [Campylobacter ureolyticus]
MLIAWITIFTLDTIYRHRNNIVTINNKNLIFWFIFSIFLSSFFIWVLYFMPILTASRRNVMMIEIMNSSLFFMWWHNVICYILIVFNIASIYAYFLEICIRIKNFFVANDKKKEIKMIKLFYEIETAYGKIECNGYYNYKSKNIICTYKVGNDIFIEERNATLNNMHYDSKIEEFNFETNFKEYKNSHDRIDINKYNNRRNINDTNI